MQRGGRTPPRPPAIYGQGYGIRQGRVTPRPRVAAHTAVATRILAFGGCELGANGEQI